MDACVNRIYSKLTNSIEYELYYTLYIVSDQSRISRIIIIQIVIAVGNEREGGRERKDSQD